MGVERFRRCAVCDRAEKRGSRARGYGRKSYHEYSTLPLLLLLRTAAYFLLIRPQTYSATTDIAVVFPSLILLPLPRFAPPKFFVPFPKTNIGSSNLAPSSLPAEHREIRRRHRQHSAILHARYGTLQKRQAAAERIYVDDVPSTAADRRRFGTSTFISVATATVPRFSTAHVTIRFYLRYRRRFRRVVMRRCR